MKAKEALVLLGELASGDVKVGKTRAWTARVMSPKARALMTATQELEAWQLYRIWAEPFEARSQFDIRSQGNSFEIRRRRVLLGMFGMIEFRSQSPAVRDLFKASVGLIGIQELIGNLGARMPHWYYVWAFDALPITRKTFGEGALGLIRNSPDHRRTFRHLDELKAVELKAHAALKAVMCS